MMTHKITIKPFGEGAYTVHVDDKKVRARSVDVHMETCNLPEVDIGLVGEPDLEVEGLVQFDYTPKTIGHAANVIKAALMKNDLTAFLAVSSINKVVEETKSIR